MLYIIYGDDDFRCHQALKDIKSELGEQEMLSVNTTVLDGRKLNLKGLMQVCDVVPFMLDKRLVIVERLLKRFSAAEKVEKESEGEDHGAKDWSDLGTYVKKMPTSTLLIIFEPDMDPRGSNAMLKKILPVADKTMQLNELKGRELATWIREYVRKKGSKMAVSAVNHLVEMGGDLWALTGEIDKLITFCGGREITERDVNEITSFDREESIFALVDAVIDGKIRESQSMIHGMLRLGTAPQQILSMVERQLSLILQVKEISHQPPNQIKELLGLNPRYPVEKTIKQVKYFNVPRLRRAFHVLLDTDIAIKTGRYDDYLALDLLVFELCNTG